MAEYTFFPFDEGDGSNLSEERWTLFFDWMRTVGVLSVDTTLDPDSELAVNPADPSVGTQIQVEDGKAFIQGFYFEQIEGPAVLDVPLNEGLDPRIDLVVLRLDKAEDDIQYVIIEGLNDAVPEPPEPIQNSTIWDLPLAQVYVASEATTITSGDITDVRVRSMQGDGGSVAVTLSSAGGDETLIADSNAPPDLVVKGLNAGTNISLSSDADSITITGANAPADAPICFVYKDSTTPGLTDGSTTTIEFDTAILNPDGMWDSMTNPSRITIDEDGVYLIMALAGWTGVDAANGPVELQILLNGSTTLTRSRMLLAGDDTLYLNAEVFYSLTATDYLTLAVINDSGQTLSLESSPQLQAIKIRG